MSNLGRVALVRSPLDDQDAHAISPFLRALADPIRLRMLSLIGADPRGEACVCDLADEFHLSQPTISYHLRILREAGLIVGQRRGTWVYYRVVTDALNRVAQLFSRPEESVRR